MSRIGARPWKKILVVITEDWFALSHFVPLISELRDGRRFTLSAGMSYQVSDLGDAAHRSYTSTGAKLFIVD